MPMAKGQRVIVGRANIGNLGNGAIRVRHREYVRDITGTTNFTVASIAVNPGIAASFPWLSAVASRFERYKFNSLRFDYVPSCSVTTSGTVMAAYDTDATDSAPTSKLQLLAYQNATRSPPWAAWSATLPRVKDFQDRYVRDGTAPTSTDLKMYDVAALHTATATTETTLLGEIYVEYDVTLLIPQFQSASSAPIAPINWRELGTTTATVGPTIFDNFTLDQGTADYVAEDGTLSFGNLPPGRYVFVYTVIGENLVGPSTRFGPTPVSLYDFHTATYINTCSMVTVTESSGFAQVSSALNSGTIDNLHITLFTAD